MQRYLALLAYLQADQAESFVEDRKCFGKGEVWGYICKEHVMSLPFYPAVPVFCIGCHTHI